jgi:hypothetical protein
MSKAKSVKSPAVEQFGQMGKEIVDNLNSDNDARVIIQGRNSQTGIGKTTLAIQMCRAFDQTSGPWDAKEKAFINIPNYLEAHLDYPKGSALLLDEIEHGADSRRSTSHENVNLSQGWATLRARNIVTIATLPSTSMLDKRMLELADYWVLVHSRGLAKPYKIAVNDFKPKRLPSRQELANGQMIQFDDLDNSDPDKKYLDEIKDQTVRGMGSDIRRISMEEHEKIIEKEREQAQMEFRNEAIRETYEKSELATTDLSNMEWVGVGQGQVSRILNETNK